MNKPSIVRSVNHSSSRRRQNYSKKVIEDANKAPDDVKTNDKPLKK